jgi:hypothetical protein
MTKITPKLVSDRLGKEWSCHLEVDNGTLIVHIEGYTKQYPLILSQDKIFVKNVNSKLHEIGYTGNVKPLLTDLDERVEYSYTDRRLKKLLSQD